MTTLDTAAQYGESESILGGIGVRDWQVVTKLPPFPEGCSDISVWVDQEVKKSLSRLKLNKLHGLLVHRPMDLLSDQGEPAFRAMQALKERQLVDKIGITVYSPDELGAIFHEFRLDIVQLPFNVFDRRMQTSGWLKKLHLASVEIHARSAFLQGLLLMEEQAIPAKFEKWLVLLHDWHRWLKEQKTTPLRASLSFALSPPEIDRVVIGVDNTEQLEQIIEAAQFESEQPPPAISSLDEDLINPSKWSIK